MLIKILLTNLLRLLLGGKPESLMSTQIIVSNQIHFLLFYFYELWTEYCWSHRFRILDLDTFNHTASRLVFRAALMTVLHLFQAPSVDTRIRLSYFLLVGELRLLSY